MGKWICNICGYVYDETKEGKPFAELPDSWVCPLCGADKSAFVSEQTERPKMPTVPIHITEDMKQLSAGELSAVCSNLARGCEKQYKDREAALFQELADFFASAVEEVPDADIRMLNDLIQKDLEEGYPALRSTAVAEADREHSGSVFGGEGYQYFKFPASALSEGRGPLPAGYPGLGLHGLWIYLCGRSGSAVRLQRCLHGNLKN
ncbi:MAG: rubredoxin [Lachnospiraceae bacterium]